MRIFSFRIKKFLINQNFHLIDNKFLEVAKEGKNHWWRYSIGIVSTFFVLIVLGYIPTEIYLDYANPALFTKAEWYEYQETMNFKALGLSNNIGLITLISSFALGLGTLLLFYKFLHKKSIINLFTGHKKIRWNHVFFGFAAWGTLVLILTFSQLLIYSENYLFQFDWSKFLPLLLICIFLLPIQTSFEEVFLRGYLFQAISLLSKTGIIPVLVTSVFFALIHLGNPEVDSYGWYIMMPYYFGVAFTAALITLMDEGLEIAIGLHAANNIFGALTITYPEAAIQVDAIWYGKNEDYNLGSLVLFYSLFLTMVYVSYLYIKKNNQKKAQL